MKVRAKIECVEFEVEIDNLLTCCGNKEIMTSATKHAIECYQASIESLKKKATQPEPEKE